jgi:two-component system, chemotaxis family, sensor kinase CheA
MSEMDEIIKEFLVESTEGLDQLDRGLVELEQRPNDQALLAAIFRSIHTIKGTSGFLGFGKLEAVTHVGESLLSDLRDGKKTLTPAITNGLLQLVDAVRGILTAIEATGADGENEFPELIDLLTRLQSGEVASPAPAVKAPRSRKAKSAKPTTPVPPEPAAAAEITAVAVPAVAVAPVAAEVAASSTAADSNIRVDVELLDRLMNLVGELVLARNQILQHSSGNDDPAFQATSQRLNLITTELQEGVMKTRMQPIGNVWAKFPRVVRDLALACQKQARLEMDGRETELDKTIIEAIKDPLTHIVRNSVDHGLELPAARVAAGKPAEGRILLRAYHEGGQVNIEIADDGGGIDPARVRAKAIQKGLLTPEQASRLSDREAVNLIFAPGFSTAEQVSNISGRGVGMDVVKTNIEKIGGTVDIHTELGRGTTLKIKIPLTLAIIPALLVTSAGDRFAIPQVSLIELLRLTDPHASGGIEMVYGAPVHRLRGRLLPLVSLNQVLGLQEDFWGPRGRDIEAVNVIVLQADDTTFGLVVDEIADTEEIVVKPLGKQLKSLRAYAGATIMGDGRVALILDVPGLAHQAGVVSTGRGRHEAENGQGSEAETAREAGLLLIFRLGEDRRVAIPLSQVARLEEIAAAQVEQAGRHRVVQYRGGLLPLLPLAEMLGSESHTGESLSVVVYTHQGNDIGLMVENIIDIVPDTVAVHRHKGSGPISGTAVIQDKVTDLLDLSSLLAEADYIDFAEPEVFA